MRWRKGAAKFLRLYKQLDNCYYPIIAMPKNNLPRLLNKIFGLLQQVEPIPDEYDVVWQAPYFIPRARQWSPSHFVFHDGHLYCKLLIEGHSYDLSWQVGISEIKFETGWSSGGSYLNDEYLWDQALSQIYQRLKRAVKNPDRYNRSVARFLPKECHTGKIKRHFTWEKKVSRPLPKSKIVELENAPGLEEKQPKLKAMTLQMYLEVVGMAYDAAFEDLRPLLPLEKYKKKADGRHGGLLDLPMDDPQAFKQWYHSGRWSGSHPWEIVFGHPHGIMLAPHHNEQGDDWRYTLWVDSLGWYVSAALMALALAARQVPFEFHRSEKVLAALKGEDDVEVGPFLGFEGISLEELKEVRPDAISYICWDPIPQILPISPEQKKRLAEVLKKVT